MTLTKSQQDGLQMAAGLRIAALNVHKHLLWSRVCDSHNEAVRMYGRSHTQDEIDAIHKVTTGYHNAWLVAKHYAELMA